VIRPAEVFLLVGANPSRGGELLHLLFADPYPFCGGQSAPGQFAPPHLGAGIAHHIQEDIVGVDDRAGMVKEDHANRIGLDHPLKALLARPQRLLGLVSLLRSLDPPCRFKRYDVCAADRAILIEDRDEIVVEPGGFRNAMPVQDPLAVFQDHRLAREHTHVERSGDLPDLLPALSRWLAQAGRMLQPHERRIGIVVDLDELWSPQQVHRERRQNQIDEALQALGPGCDGTKGRGSPIVVSHACAHDAAIGQKLDRILDL
jgi:hypothetical protein